MNKTNFHIKGAFDGTFLVDKPEWDEKGVRCHPFYYTNMAPKGRIWIDGIELNSERARQLRKGFSDKNSCFTWGWAGSQTRITALAICLYIFNEEQTALNMYLPFKRTYLNNLSREDFEIDLDITDFVSANKLLMSKYAFTQYIDAGFLNKYEILFEKNIESNNYSADLLTHICIELLNREEEKYRQSNAVVFYGNKKIIPKNDLNDVLDKKRKELLQSWFDRRSTIITATSLKTAVAKARQMLKRIDQMRTDYLYELNKQKIDRVKKIMMELIKTVNGKSFMRVGFVQQPTVKTR